MIATARRRATPAVGAATAVPAGRPPRPRALADGAPIARVGADPLAATLSRCVERRTLARWHLLASAGYAQASPHGSIGSAFTWQEDDITIQPRPGGAAGSGIQYRQHAEAAPNLKVSADNSVAMQDSPGEVKEVYLAPQARAAANASLQAVASPIKLGKAGHAVTVNAYNGAPQRTLEKVRPKLRAAQPNAAAINAADFPTLAALICRDVAEHILGGKLTQIQLSDQAGHTQHVAASTTDSNIVTGTQQLAAAVASKKLSLAAAAAKMAVAKVPKPGKEYGRATRKSKFAQRAAGLGINEDAWARAGQAYVIQSAYAKAGDTRNYSDPAEAPLVGGGFGYHFAAVVAESLDGHEAVTLENYRRSGEVEAGARELLDHLKVRFAADLHAAMTNVGAFNLHAEEQVGAILHFVETHTAPDFNQASDKWQQIVSELGKPGALWFFRMVSRDDPDQSFHRQLARSGYFASPVTLVMHK